MKRRIKKIIFILLGIVTFVGVIKYHFFPAEYPYGGFWQPMWWWKCKYDFCKYDVPNEYKFLEYADAKLDKDYDKRMIIYRDTVSGQILTITRLREYLDINLDLIELSKERIVKTNRTETNKSAHGFNVVYLLPFFRNDDVQKTQDLTLRGINLMNKEDFETDKTRVKYFSGTFKKIGFYKKNTNILFRYPTPVFDFLEERRGALAIVKDKATKETLIVTGWNRIDKEFDEEEFKGIVKSLTFDKEPCTDSIEDFSRPPKIESHTTINIGK